LYTFLEQRQRQCVCDGFLQTYYAMSGLSSVLPVNETLGETIPPDTPHAVSVSLPTWRANVGYEEGQRWVVEKMKCGYPRFFIHPSINHLAQCIVRRHGSPESEKAMLFPTTHCAARCVAFLKTQNSSADGLSVRTLDFTPNPDAPQDTSKRVLPSLSAVIYPKELWPTAKVFWQHTGEGISSRRAEYCQRAFDDGSLVDLSSLAQSANARLVKGPRRYQRPLSIDHGSTNGVNGHANGQESVTNGDPIRDSALFVEERFGRNMEVAFTAQAKLAIRKRIAGSLTTDAELPDSLDAPESVGSERVRDTPGFSVDDVYLYSCGMNAIYNAHRTLRLMRGDNHKSVMWGFPYVDTLKVLEKFGAGAIFYGLANSKDLDHLEARLESGERFLSLFCEFPGNPLLTSPDLKRLRALADKYDFAVVVDETIGNWLNVHVLPYADVVVSSLTKIFSGDSNVMGGAMILNPRSRYYQDIKHVLATDYEDNQFGEDSVYLERNSRDFINRVPRVNHNAEAIADTLMSHPSIKKVHYPKYSESKHHYDACRLPNGGYGGLLSATFHRVEDAQIFYDHVDTHKGPSLGTNFTLSSPFVLLAHYNELEWAAQYGCELSLVRFSVGLEDTEALKRVFESALAAIPNSAG